MPGSPHHSQNSSPIEKLDHVEEKASVNVSDEAESDEKLVRRTVHKVDMRLLPILGALYACEEVKKLPESHAIHPSSQRSLIDRNNLSNVRVSGADKEIGLAVGNHYSLTTLVFFIPYIILEVPSNIVFRRVGASLYLGTIGLLWGAIMVCMGFVKTWNQMAALRGLLGILEAGFFPACVWLISCWYKRSEVQVRLAAFYLVSVVVGSFSNILAYGLSTIKAGHLSGWRWILIVEGIVTCCLGVLGYFIIVDFPDKNKFLTADETALLIARVERDRADSVHDTLTWKKAFTYTCDLKLWSFAVAFMCTTMVAYAYGYFTPIILIGLGFSIRDAQLLIAPTGVAACIFALSLSKLSDRYGSRGPFIVLQALMAITGLSMTGFHPKNAVRFAGVFIGFAGAQGNIPALLAYQSNNVRRQSKRAFSSALQVSFGGVGGIIASLAYRQQDAPKYRLGIIITIALQGLIILCVCLNTLWFIYRNRQARSGGKLIEDQAGFLYTL